MHHQDLGLRGSGEGLRESGEDRHDKDVLRLVRSKRGMCWLIDSSRIKLVLEPQSTSASIPFSVCMDGLMLIC